MGSKRKAERAERAAYWTSQAQTSAAKAKAARENAAFHRAESRKRGRWADPQAHRALAATCEQDMRVHEANARDHRQSAASANRSLWQEMRRSIRHGRAKNKRARRTRNKNFRKRLAHRLNLPPTTTTTKHPTPKRTKPKPPTIGGKNTTPAPRTTTSPTGKAAPMTERVKRTKGGKFNGSQADKNNRTGAKKTVAPNPEQRRLLAANTKAAQIDARLKRTEARIDRMFPEP